MPLVLPMAVLDAEQSLGQVVTPCAEGEEVRVLKMVDPLGWLARETFGKPPAWGAPYEKHPFWDVLSRRHTQS